MDLSIDELCSKLNNYNAKLYKYNSQNSSPVRGVSFLLLNQTSFEQDILYVCLSLDYLNSISTGQYINLMCTSNIELNTVNEKFQYANLLIIDSAVSFFEVYNEIQKILLETKKRNEILSEVLKGLVEGKGMEYMIGLSYELLGNPLVISDVNYKLLGYSKGADFCDPMVNEIIKRGYVPNEMFTAKKKSSKPAYEKEGFKSGKPNIEKPYDNLCRRLYGRINVRDRRLATIIVYEANKPFEDKDIEIVDILCNAFALEIQKKSFNLQNRALNNEAFLIDLIEEKFTEYGAIQNTAQILNLKFEKRLYVFTLDLSLCDISRFSFAYVQKELEDLMPCCLTTRYGDWIVMLVSSDTEIFDDNSFIRKLHNFMKNTKLIAGLSLCFSKLSETRKHFQQSVKAMELRLRLKQDAFLCNYKDYFVYDIIDTASTQTDMMKACHPILFEILEHDRQNNTFYAETLHAYLLKWKDNNSTASYLHIHRNTLNYRIGNLEELFNISLKDDSTLLDLLLSFKILEYYGLLKF